MDLLEMMGNPDMSEEERQRLKMLLSRIPQPLLQQMLRNSNDFDLNTTLQNRSIMRDQQGMRDNARFNGPMGPGANMLPGVQGFGKWM